MTYLESRWKTEFSIGTAIGRIGLHVDQAIAAGMDTVALCEANTLRHIYALHEECTKKGVRPVYGVELSVVPNHLVHGLTEEERAEVVGDIKGKRDARKLIAKEERKRGLDKVWKIAARAMDAEGLKNLFKLTSTAWDQGFYQTPKVDLDLLEKHSTGVQISIGGANGLAIEPFLKGNSDLGIEQLDRLQEIFEDRLYLEIRPHMGTDVSVNKLVALLSKSRGIPVVAVNDVRYPTSEDMDAHTVSLCIARRSTFEDPNHPRSAPGYHIRSGEEMAIAFKTSSPELDSKFVKKAIANSKVMLDDCQAVLDIDYKRALVPNPGTSKDAPDVEIRNLCESGWEWRGIDEKSAKNGYDYRARLEHELSVISNAGFSSYFLYVRDIVNWCRSKDIMVGPGRGSAAGALICYLLGITSVDPLEHKLMFERFISVGRSDLPDIDQDISQFRRGEVLEYIRNKYGHEYTSSIVTYNRLHGKSVIKDVARVMGLESSEVNAITAAFPNKQGEEKRPVREILKGTEVGRAFMRNNPELMKLAERLEGTIRQTSVHAAGIIASPIPITDVCPVEIHRKAGEQTRIAALDMGGIAALGLVKFDALGLANLDVLHDCAKAIEKLTGEVVDYEALEFDDTDTIDAFSRQEFTGIFQYDANSARNVCEGLEFDSFEDVAALTALNRPGCTRSGLTEKFRERRIHPERREDLHPIYDEITKDTLGVLVYQEQVIRIFREFSDYSPEDADKMRKVMGKKLGEAEMERHRERFLQGTAKRGIDELLASDLFSSIGKFAEYAFNRSHSISYAAIAYWEMWAKVKYPAAFVWSLMANAKDSDEAMSYVNEAQRLGVKILPPHVNRSDIRWAVSDSGKSIRAGLSDVKGVGVSTTKTISDAKPFKNMADFFERVPGRAANSRVLKSLVKAGAFAGMLPSVKWALENEVLWLGVRKKKNGLETLLKNIEEAQGSPEYPEEDLLALAVSVAPQTVGRHPLRVFDNLFSGGRLDTNRWTGLDKIWKRENAFIRGIIIDVKYRQIGEFGGGSELSEAKKTKMQWGKQYAVIQVEDDTNTKHQIKLEPNVFDKFKSVLDRGVGTAIVASVSVSQAYKSIRVQYIATLEDLRQKDRLHIPYTFWESCFTEDHPIKSHTKVSLVAKADEGKTFLATVLITGVKTVIDKNENEMAFFSIQDGYGDGAEVVCFSKVFENFGPELVHGAVVQLKLQIGGKSFVLHEDGITKKITKV